MGSRTNRQQSRTVETKVSPEMEVRDDTIAGKSRADAGPGPVPSFELSPYFFTALTWQWWVAALMLVPAVPILAVAMLLVRCTSRGPALYRQTRVGLNGRHFQLIKVRTMRIDAESETGAVWTTTLKDPRITFIGRILRWTHIDELPQLWNVLCGEMALVGPRPERPEFTGMLAASIPGYLDRLAVLPGVTGLAQVNLPADTGIESVKKKLELDRQYLREGSLSLDLRIILCTAARVIGLRSLRLRRLLNVSRKTGPSWAGESGGVGGVAELNRDTSAVRASCLMSPDTNKACSTRESPESYFVTLSTVSGASHQDSR